MSDFPTTPDVSAGDFGRESWADAVVSDLTQLGYAEYELGGSLENAIPTTSQVLAYEARPVKLRDARYIDNFVWTIAVRMKVDSGGSVIAEVKDDLGASVHIFTAHTSTSLIEQKFAFTPNPAREYWLYFTNSNDPIPAYGYGKIIRSIDTL